MTRMHVINEPASHVILDGGMPEGSTPVMGLQVGVTQKNIFGGQPHTQITVMPFCTNGELATIAVQGSVDGLTAQAVQAGIRTLSFVKVKFTGLTLEVKGGDFNSVTYFGTAEKAEIVTAAPVAGKS